MTLALDTTALLHLLQLASPSLPVGGYSYSQALEVAMEKHLVTDEESARQWLISMLHESVARFEAPLLLRLIDAWSRNDERAVMYWNDRALAARDTAEFRAETVQMGYSLARLARDLDLLDEVRQRQLDGLGEVHLQCAFALVTVALSIPPPAALLGMLFSWAENQVLVCVKSVPLGQVAGQRLLLSLRPELQSAALAAQALDDDAMCNWTPGLSLLSMQHEVQYSRLYRS